MAASILYLVLIFGSVSAAALLLVGLHDVIAAYFERHSERVPQDGGGGNLPLPLLLPPRARRFTSKAQRAPQPLALRGATEPLRDRPNEAAGERPAWLDSAQRDVAHR